MGERRWGIKDGEGGAEIEKNVVDITRRERKREFFKLEVNKVS